MTADTLSALPDVRPPLLSLRGRLSRVEFIAYSMLCGVVAMLLLSAFGHFLLLFPASLARNWYLIVALLVVNLLLPVLVSVLAVKRLHDIGKPGWLAGLLVVPVANVLLVLALWAWPGERRRNVHGEIPAPAGTLVVAAATALPLLLVAGYLSSGPLDDEWLRAAGLRAVGRNGSPPTAAPTALRPY